MKRLLLINGVGSSVKIINELLSEPFSDINIYLSYPLGVLTIAGWVRKELPEIEIQILDVQMDLHKIISEKNRTVLSFDNFLNEELDKVHFIPDYIGVSMSFSNGHNACLKMIGACKKKWMKSKIIVGGMHASTFTSKIISNSNVDYVVKGPGDISFIGLLKALEEDKNSETIPGVVSGLQNITNTGVILEDLDNIPFYPYDLIDMEYLIVHESTSPIYEQEKRTGLILMSRGCPFPCIFCSANKIHGKKVFFKSIKRIISEIDYLIHNYKINQLCIIDDLFGANKKYFFNFFNEIEKRHYKLNIVIPGGLSINLFDESMVDKLVKHGLKAVNFPLESGSKFVQNEIIKKHINLAKAISLINYAKEKGLFVGLNIVVGFPNETKELMFETFEFVKKLPVDWTSFFIAYPYPGTKMTEILFQRGELNDDKLIEVWETSTQGFKERPFDTIEITGKELSELVYDYNIELNFFNNYNFLIKNYKNLLLKINKIVNRYTFHVVALSCRAKCYFCLGETVKAKEDIKTMYNLIASNNKSKKMYEKYKDKIEETINFKYEIE